MSTKKSDRGEGKGGKEERVGFVERLGKAGEHVDQML